MRPTTDVAKTGQIFRKQGSGKTESELKKCREPTEKSLKEQSLDAM